MMHQHQNTNPSGKRMVPSLQLEYCVINSSKLSHTSLSSSVCFCSMFSQSLAVLLVIFEPRCVFLVLRYLLLCNLDPCQLNLSMNQFLFESINGFYCVLVVLLVQSSSFWQGYMGGSKKCNLFHLILIFFAYSILWSIV